LSSLEHQLLQLRNLQKVEKVAKWVTFKDTKIFKILQPHNLPRFVDLRELVPASGWADAKRMRIAQRQSASYEVRTLFQNVQSAMGEEEMSRSATGYREFA
jgi:hypothetical protein